MSRNKVIAIVVIVLGLALVTAAVYTLVEPPKEGGVLTVAGQIIAFLLGAGANIKGWMDLFKKEKPAEPAAKNIAFDKGQVAGEGGRNIQSEGPYIEGDVILHLPEQEAKTHDSIGYIPAASVTTYIHRGTTEEEVKEFLRIGNGSGAIVGLHAPGGLAKHAADELKGQFEGILWIDVGEKTPPQVVGDMLLKCGVQTRPGAAYAELRNELHHAM